MVKNKPQEKSAKIKTKTVNANTVKTNKSFPLSMNSIITIICISVATWFGYKGYLETRVNTPYDGSKACIISYFYIICLSLKIYVEEWIVQNA